jgi:glycosyltransferase involved in cell wall biosynthesis
MTISVRLVQPLIPKYRLPVFALLARQPGIRLSVWADLHPKQGSLDGVSGSDDFECVDAPMIRRGPFFWQPREHDAVVSPGADIVILSWISRNPFLGRSLAKARASGKGTILWGHGFGTTVPWLGEVLRDRLVRKADALCFYGPTSLDRYRARGVSPDRLFVAPNAIDQRPIAEARARWLDDAKRSAFRRERGLGDGPVVVYLSRLEPEKRPDVLLDALAILARSRPDARVVFIGKGSEREPLERKAAALGLADKVVFAGPIYEDEALAPWCSIATCLVQPGALGLSIFHAFGFGMPVVTSGNLAIQMPETEALVDGVNGLFYRHLDADDLAATIRRLVDDPGLRGRLSEGALATVTGPEGRNVEGMVAGFTRAIQWVARTRSDAARRGR